MRPDALLHVLDGVLVGGPAPQGGVRRELGGREGGRGVLHGAAQVLLHGVEPGDGVRVRLVDSGGQVVVVDRVGDQQDAAVPVVEDGEVGGEQHRQLGELQVVAAALTDLLQPAHDVVAEVADHAAGEGRQSGFLVVRGVQRLDGRAQGLERVAVDGDADGRGAEPVGLAVAGGERGCAAYADEGVPRPGAAVLRGFEEEGAGAFPRELAVETDRGVAVREEPHG